jgi:serine protease AprX
VSEISNNKQLIPANILLVSNSGKSILVNTDNITPNNIKDFLPSREVIEEAKKHLQHLGFIIDIATETHISIFGTKELFEKIFGIHLIEKTSPVFHPSNDKTPVQYYYEADTKSNIPPQLSGLVEDIIFPGPPIYYALSASPPALSYDHLEVPNDVARDMDAVKVHNRGQTGRGIILAMVDSGFMTPFHPYYMGRPYSIRPIIADPRDPSPSIDEIGHGTGIAACALAVAPDVTFIPVKIMLDFSNATSMFSRAVIERPHVITCSWTTDFDPTLRMAINNAIAGGIVVLFACGNGGEVGWPGSEPGVISVGGASIDSSDYISASSYASSGMNTSNPGRQCPDVCGLVGSAPMGIYIALPTQPGSELDIELSGGIFPSGDQTLSNDGWLVASGTSSATPMVAAVVSLLMNVDSSYIRNPALVKNRLIATCIDVTSGTSASGERASAGRDNATGSGLIQAYRTCYQIDLWMKDNNTSDIGLVPVVGRRPHHPPHTHWTSTDIKVFSSILTDPRTQFEYPESPILFGHPSYVYVKVRNRGSIANRNRVILKLYYGDPSTRLVYSGDWHLIGEKNISASLLSHDAALVVSEAFIWNPPDPSSATESQILPDRRTRGHFCLLTRLESTDDPIVTEGSVIGENNIAMKNVHIYSGSPGTMFLYKFYIRGVSEENEQQTTQNDLVIDLSDLPQGCNVILKTSDGSLNPKEIRNAKLENEGAIVLIPSYDPSVIANFTMKAEERVLVQLTAESSKFMKGGDYIISVQQLSEGTPVGGVDLILRMSDR